MTTAHLDIESFSECDLKECGLYKYAEDPSTEILCVGYAFDEEDVLQWRPGQPLPLRLVAHIEAGGELRAHNAQFERVVLNGVAGKKIGFPSIAIEQTVCTAVKAAQSGIPRALGDGSKALGTYPKSEAGRLEMLALCKPRKPTKADPSTRFTVESAPEKFAAMYAYNLDDVRAERDLDNALPDIEEKEHRLYDLDQKVNDRGWAADLTAINNILAVVEAYKTELAAECEAMTNPGTYEFDKKTGDFVPTPGLSPTQREKIADWIRAQGYTKLPDMTADTVKWVLKEEGCPPQVKRMLKIYNAYNAKSVSKLQAILNMVCADGRLRGMFMFYGAATGRWSSLGVQLQNLMRPVIKDPNTAIEAFADRDLDTIRFLYPGVDVMKVAGSCIRGCLIAGPNAMLVYPDYSGVEDRGNLWMFDETFWMQAYRDYDAGKGRHPYSITACKLLGLDLATFSDDDPRRQIGKVVRLAMGYEGGVSAFVKMAETYQLDLEEMAAVVIPTLPEQALDHAAWMHKNHPNTSVSPEVETACNGIKFIYRNESPGIKQGWKDLRLAAEQAVEFEGQAFWLPNKKVAFKVETYKGRKWLAMRLPSGRKIKYYNPTWTPPRESERYINNELVPYTIPGYFEYWGIDTDTRQWVKQQTYGGKLDENLIQGFCRDLLAHAMLALDAEGFCIIASEHDKAIIEVHEKLKSVDRIKELMLAQPDYAAGLPLTCDGKKVKRYSK